MILGHFDMDFEPFSACFWAISAWFWAILTWILSHFYAISGRTEKDLGGGYPPQGGGTGAIFGESGSFSIGFSHLNSGFPGGTPGFWPFLAKKSIFGPFQEGFGPFRGFLSHLKKDYAHDKKDLGVTRRIWAISRRIMGVTRRIYGRSKKDFGPSQEGLWA